MTALLLPLMLQQAVAADAPAFYNPDDVAAKSVRFAEVSDQAGPAFDKAQAAVSALGKELADLELGVALVGSAAPPALKTWAEQTRKSGMAQYLEIQNHVNALQDGYTGVFGAAMDRALKALGRPAVQCQSQGKLGPMGVSGGNCKGDNLNATLASAMDADPVLQADLVKLSGSPWPALSVSGAAQPVVAMTGDTRWISAAELAHAFMADRLQTRTEDLDGRLAPLEDALDAHDKDAIAKAGLEKQDYLDGIGKDGAALRAAATAALGRAAKHGGPSAVGLCANPRALGGCVGEDVSATALPLLQADSKLRRAISAYEKKNPLPAPPMGE